MADKNQDFDDENEEGELKPKDGTANQRPDSDIFDDDPQPDHAEDDIREVSLDERANARARGDGPVEDDDDIADSPDGDDVPNVEKRVPDQDEDGNYLDRATGRPYGERVQKDIAKRVARQRAAEARADKAERELAEERAKGRDREFRDAEGSVTHFDREIKRLDELQKEVKASLIKAREEGNVAEDVELTARLNQVQIDRTQADYGQKNAKARFESVKTEREKGGTGGDRSVDSRETPNRTPLTERWLQGNASWYGSRDYAAETMAVQGIEQALSIEVRQGKFAHGPETTQYFREVDRRLKQLYPDVPVAATGDRGNPRGDRGNDRTRRRAASPVGGSRGGPATDRGSRGKESLTREDLATMRSFKLDPSNPVDVKAFADQKRAQTLQDSRDGE